MIENSRKSLLADPSRRILAKFIIHDESSNDSAFPRNQRGNETLKCRANINYIDFCPHKEAQPLGKNSQKPSKGKILQKTSAALSTGRWTEEEHQKFLEGILLYGNKWVKVQKCVASRSSSQARSHAQKLFLRIKRYLNRLDKKKDGKSLEDQSNVKTNDQRPSFEVDLMKGQVRNIEIILNLISNLDIPNPVFFKNFSSKQKENLISVALKYASKIEIVKSEFKKFHNKSSCDNDKKAGESKEERPRNVKGGDIFKIIKLKRMNNQKIKHANPIVLRNLNVSIRMKETTTSTILSKVKEVKSNHCEMKVKEKVGETIFTPNPENSDNSRIHSTESKIYEKLSNYFLNKRKSEIYRDDSSKTNLITSTSIPISSPVRKASDSCLSTVLSSELFSLKISTIDLFSEAHKANPFILNFDQVLDHPQLDDDRPSDYTASESMQVEFDYCSLLN